METYIKEYEKKHKGKHCFYLLRLPKIVIGTLSSDKPTYKFGITSDVGSRLRTHLRNLNFTEIIVIKECADAQVVAALETKIKRTAEGRRERVNIMGNTELIQTDNIAEYISIIHEQVNMPDQIDPDIDVLLKSLTEPNDVTIVITGNNATVNVGKSVFCCEDCGKGFSDNKDLHRHRNRKRPCLIREVPPDQMQNPNRCTFCNKIFVNIGNKNKHLKTCGRKIPP